MEIRPYQPEDAAEIARLVQRNLLEVNIRDYDATAMAEMAAGYNADKIRRIAGEGHMYVALEQGTIIGVGAVAPYQGSLDVSQLHTVFILPERQGQGLGSAVLSALEADEYFRRAERVLADASITARPFYEKKGYIHPGGQPVLVDNDYYPMEKRRPDINPA